MGLCSNFLSLYIYRFYDEEGNLKEEGEFVLGERHKLFKKYYEDGKYEEIRYCVGKICHFNPNDNAESKFISKIVLVHSECDCQVCTKLKSAKELAEN